MPCGLTNIIPEQQWQLRGEQVVKGLTYVDKFKQSTYRTGIGGVGRIILEQDHDNYWMCHMRHKRIEASV
jgi:hypothetical protein